MSTDIKMEEKMQLRRKILIYMIGLLVMALGIVLIKKAELGMSPISAIPAAVANITPLSLGNTTILFHLLCILFLILLLRKITLKMILLLPLAIIFGYIIDFYMAILQLPKMNFWLRCVICFVGTVLTALGIVLIAGTDFMLPAPDAFVRAFSECFQRPLSTTKIAGDVTWVILQQRIVHSQEVPPYQKTIMVACESPVDCKVFCIDDEKHSTMLYADEY